MTEDDCECGAPLYEGRCYRCEDLDAAAEAEDARYDAERMARTW